MKQWKISSGTYARYTMTPSGWVPRPGCFGIASPQKNMGVSATRVNRRYLILYLSPRSLLTAAAWSGWVLEREKVFVILILKNILSPGIPAIQREVIPCDIQHISLKIKKAIYGL